MTFQPQEKISLNEAIFLKRDITTPSPQQLLHTKVLRTIVQADTVFISTSNQPASPTNGAND